MFASPCFASADECERVLEVASDWPRIATLEFPAEHDDAGFCYELPVAWDPLLPALGARIDALLGMRNHAPDTFRFRRYARGEAHPPHLDCYEIEGLHLVTTAMLCLEAPEQGGETSFAATGLRVLPRAGQLVWWHNYLPDGREDRRARHAGLRVGGGCKTTITWFVYVPLPPSP